MFTSCLQIQVALSEPNLYFSLQDNNSAFIQHSEISSSRTQNVLKIVSLGGPFVDRSNVYVVMLINEDEYILGINEGNLFWTETISLGDSQVFQIVCPDGLELAIESIFCIGKVHEGKYNFLCITRSSDDSIQNYQILLKDVENRADLYVLQFTFNTMTASIEVPSDESLQELPDIPIDTTLNIKNEKLQESVQQATTDINQIENSSDISSFSSNAPEYLSAEFMAGPLGIVIKRYPNNIIYVQDIIVDTQAAQKNIKIGDEITAVGEINISKEGLNKEQFSKLIQYIRDSPRPLIINLKRNSTPEVTNKYLSDSQTTQANIANEVPPPSATTTTTSNTSESDIIVSNQASESTTTTTHPVVTQGVDEELLKLSKKLIFRDKRFSTSTSSINSPEKSRIYSPSIQEPIPPFVQDNRRLIKLGEIQIETKGSLWNTVNKKTLLLTSDILLLCAPSQGDSLLVESSFELRVCKLKYSNSVPIRSTSKTVSTDRKDPISEVVTGNKPSQSQSSNSSLYSFEIISPQGNMSLQCKSLADRDDWVYSIYTAICGCIREDEKGFGWRHQCISGSFHSAVLARDENKVRQLLQACEDGGMDALLVDCQDEDGYTPLHLACILRLQAIVEVIHSHCDVTVLDNSGLSPLHWAAMQLDDFSLQLLCTHLQDVDIFDSYDRTPLFLACVEGRDVHGKTDIPALKRCLSCLIFAGADVNTRDKSGLSPIHYLAASWHCEVVQTLVDAGADVNIKSHYDESSPLHVCCACSPLKKKIAEGVRILTSSRTINTALATGDIKLTAATTAGADADVEAEVVNRLDLIPTLRTLIHAGNHINQKNSQHQSPLQILISSNSHYDSPDVFDAVLLLLQLGARIEEGVLSDFVSFCSDSTHAQGKMSQDIAAAVECWENLSTSVFESDANYIRLNCFNRPAITSNDHSNSSSSSDSSDGCTLCQTAFTLFRRQHHCRLCDALCCNDCSKKRVRVPESSAPVRVCDSCFCMTFHYLHLRSIQLSLKQRPPPILSPQTQTVSSSSSSGAAVGAESLPSDTANIILTELTPNHSNTTVTATTTTAANSSKDLQRAQLFGNSRPNKATKASPANEANVRTNALQSSLSEARDRLEERGQKLSQLSDKSADLAKSSQDFAKMAKMLNEQNKNRWW